MMTSEQSFERKSLKTSDGRDGAKASTPLNRDTTTVMATESHKAIGVVKQSNQSKIRAVKWACSGFTAAVSLAHLYGRAVSGVCPVYEPLDSYDVESYTGIWYELQRDKQF